MRVSSVYLRTRPTVRFCYFLRGSTAMAVHFYFSSGEAETLPRGAHYWPDARAHKRLKLAKTSLADCGSFAPGPSEGLFRAH